MGFSAESNINPGDSNPASVKFDVNKYKGKKLLLFFYSLDEPRLGEAVEIIKDFYNIRREYNFDVAGLSMNTDRVAEVMKFNRDNSISFPLFFDQNQEFSSRYKIKGKTGFFVYNKRGKRLGGVYVVNAANIQNIWRGFAGRYLNIGYVPEDEPILGIKPQVPFFEKKAINGDLINIRDVFQAKPVIITIFSPRCKNCVNELDFLNTIYSTGELKGKFEIVAISIHNKKATEKFINEKKFVFPVIVDRKREIASLFPSFLGPIPVSFVVDSQGRINALHTGFNDYLKDVYVMELKKLAGLPNPPLLLESGCSGEKRCGICHEQEHIQWSLTSHSDAFLSLIRKGKETDQKCVPCHVTGYGKKGGYGGKRLTKLSKYLRGVQCESCHGPGHESCSAFNKETPVQKKAKNWNKLCLNCHTKKESLNFVFAKRFPKVLHSVMPDLTTMDREERLKLIRKYREKKDIFDNTAKYVGAEACRECHSQEYDHWEKTVHAGVYKVDKAKSARPENIFRYNTGAGSLGGFPEPGREGVQCESCHGPGEKHLAKPEAKGQGYIVSLDSACSNCVVEQICRLCHSSSYDPDFDFEKQINQVRHKAELKTSRKNQE